MKKIIKRILILIIILIIAAAALWAAAYFHRSDPKNIIQYETTNPFINGTTQISAHRSGSGIMPEETLMAFENCVKNDSFSVDFFEFDLHITKDNVLVLLHDDELDRTSDSETVFGETGVRPENKTYEELRTLNMGAKFVNEAGEMPYADLHGADVPDNLKILSLDAILDYLTAHDDYNYIIEVKNEGDLGKKSVDLLYATLKERDLLDKVIFGCFISEISEYADDTCPGMIRSAYPSEVSEFYFASLFNRSDYEPEFKVLQIPFASAKDSYYVNLGTARVINYAHKHNLAVQYWTVNKEEHMEYLIRLGTDCIISDYPDKLYSVRESLDSE